MLYHEPRARIGASLWQARGMQGNGVGQIILMILAVVIRTTFDGQCEQTFCHETATFAFGCRNPTLLSTAAWETRHAYPHMIGSI